MGLLGGAISEQWRCVTDGGLEVVGGCCGTDARHVAALGGVPPP